MTRWNGATDAAPSAAGTAERPEPVTGPGHWLGAGAAVCTVGWGANQFAPLLLLYRSRLGLSAATVEATFGLYAIGLIPGLLVAGPLSDRVGRRRVVLFAVALSMVSGLVLVAGAHVAALLFAGRVLMGVASGCAFSAGAAWIKELSSPPYEDAPHGAGARRAGVAMTVGFGLGPLVAGVLAQWAPIATTLPYLPQLALGALALPLAARTRETVPSRQDGGARRRPGGFLRVQGLGDRRFLWVVLPLAPWVFGSAAISMVYLPGLVIGQVSGLAVVFAAVAAMSTAMSGVFVQPLARRLDSRGGPGRPPLLVAGLATVVLGTLAAAGVTLLDGLGWGQPVLALLVAVVLGCGYGVCLVFGLAEVQRLARPADLAGMTSVFQAFTYLGFAVPYVLSVLRSYASPCALLLWVAGLAVVTLAFTTWQAGRTAARH